MRSASIGVRTATAVLALSSLLLATNIARAAAAENDPRPDPDACTLLSDLELEPLLFAGSGGTLDAENANPAPGFVTCRWSARPRDHAADAVPRVATLAHYHLADAQHARAQMDRQVGRDPRPSLAVTGQDDDAIVRPSPTLVIARHGADIAMFDATGAELDRPEQVEARYLLDALALKAAGAAVKSPPWAPGRVAGWAPLGAAGGTDEWTPPPHPAPPGARFVEPLIHGLKTLAGMPFAVNAVLLPIALALFFFGDRRRRKDADGRPAATRRRRWPTVAGLVVTAIIVCNATLGATAANALIDRFGVAGAAIVTGRFATSTQYNRHDVIGYRVQIHVADRRVVDGAFRTDDFNVRGLGDETIYPDLADVFTVRYLPEHPQDFVIRNDDLSPWARKLACARLAAARDDSMRQAGASDDPAARDASLRARSAAQAAGCSS